VKPGGKWIRITTRYRSVAELIERMHAYCDESSLFVATRAAAPVGTEAPFELLLGHGRAVLRGWCVVLEVWSTRDNRYRRPGVLLELQGMTPNSRRVFDELRAARAAAQTSSGAASGPPRLAEPLDADSAGPFLASAQVTRPLAARRRAATGTLPLGAGSSSVPFAVDTDLITQRYTAAANRIGRVQFARASWPPPQLQRARGNRSLALSTVLRSLEDSIEGPRARGRRRPGERFALPLPVPDEPVAKDEAAAGASGSTGWTPRGDEARPGSPGGDALLGDPPAPLAAPSALAAVPAPASVRPAVPRGWRGLHLVLAIAVALLVALALLG